MNLSRILRRGMGIAMMCACSLRAPMAVSQEPHSELAGKEIYERWCQPCHGEGADKPGTAALRAKYMGRIPALLVRRTDLSADIIKQYVRHGVSIMAPFRKTEISDQELEALARYLASASTRDPNAH